MKRQLTASSQPLSLFSFLDILGGTIGILTLIIAVFMIQMAIGNQIVQLVPEGGSTQEKIASYIICNGSGEIEIHDQGGSYITNIGDARILTLFNSIKASSDRYLILGVRPNGFNDFKVLRDRAESQRITIGYEPLDEGWRLRAPGGTLL
jgi:hypothetical protein